jgi:alginate O-acetyltransferase complex protein AlgI
MLFNSHAFVLVFLPIVLAVYLWLAPAGQRRAAAWLVMASLFFYGWWDPRYLILLVASIALNFAFGRAIAGAGSRRAAKSLLVAGIACNLATLGYFKYAGFFLSLLPAAGQPPGSIASIVLPLGISFFTMTQIAFLVDVWEGKTREPSFLHNALFDS